MLPSDSREISPILSVRPKLRTLKQKDQGWEKASSHFKNRDNSQKETSSNNQRRNESSEKTPRTNNDQQNNESIHIYPEIHIREIQQNSNNDEYDCQEFAIDDHYIEDDLEKCSISAETTINDTYSRLYSDFTDQTEDNEEFSQDIHVTPTRKNCTILDQNSQIMLKSMESSRESSTMPDYQTEGINRRLSFSSITDTDNLTPIDININDSTKNVPITLDHETDDKNTSIGNKRSLTRKTQRSNSTRKGKSDATGYHISKQDDFFVPIPFSDKSIKIRDFSTKSSTKPRK